MANRTFNLTNGVSFGAQYEAVAADATANEITFIFKAAGSTTPVDYPIVASFLIVTAANVNYPLVDAVITYPANGTVKIASGSTFDIVAGHKYSVIAQRADITAE